MLSGTYKPEDVIFLLKEVEMEFTSIRDKERNIQSGKAHYSEMIHFEPAPDEAYLQLFEEMVSKYGDRMASEAAGLAQHISKQHTGPITLLSLARAGTPVGALLNRILKQRYGRDSMHYSISIIRDRGIDENALRYVIESAKRPRENFCFVDGWTAKGVITSELRKAIRDWNLKYSEWNLPDKLYVISDIGGTADVAATTDDYAIPSGILNAPVSGLLSRSILNREHIAAHDFHGTVIYKHLASIDRSNWFLDLISEKAMTAIPAEIASVQALNVARDAMKTYMAELMEIHGIRNINLIKPGVAEATRVMMRRIPRLLILRNQQDSDVGHLLHLSVEKGVEVRFDPEMPLKAVALIENRS